MARNDRLCLLDVSTRPKKEVLAFERALAGALRDVMTDLVFTNAGLLISYIHAGKVAVIEDIIASSCERSLKPDVLRYGRHALTHSDWGQPPIVCIDLELHHDSLTVYFKLVFDERSVGVEIDSIVFATPFGGHADCLARLSAALKDAHVAVA